MIDVLLRDITKTKYNNYMIHTLDTIDRFLSSIIFKYDKIICNFIELK